MIGVGVMVAPLVTMGALKYRNRPTDALALMVGWNVLCALVVVLGVKETLPVEKRKPFQLQVPNPLAFVRLFTAKLSNIPASCSGRELYTTAWLYMLGQIPGGTQISDHNIMFMQQSCNFGPQLANLSVVAYGVLVMLTGAFVTKNQIMRFGPKGHTLVCVVETVLGFLLWSIPKAWAHFPGIIIQGFGYGRGDTVYAAGLKWSEKAGMGKGEAAALFQALRGFMAIVMPMLYARMYGVGVRAGVPGICFLVGAASAVFCGFLNHVGLSAKAYEGPPAAESS